MSSPGLLLWLPPSKVINRLASTLAVQVIAKAKVPIVKFEDAETGYAFDVSFDVANGPEVRVSGKACSRQITGSSKRRQVHCRLLPHIPPSLVLLVAHHLCEWLRTFVH